MNDTLELISLKDYSVLYVEDSSDVREELAKFLQRRMKEVYLADNGKAGFESFTRNRPDVIITDLRMPIMNGLDMTREIRKIDIGTPIIILTAFNELDSIMTAINIGVDRYVMKPVDPENLMATISKSVENLYHQKRIEEQNRRLAELNRQKNELLGIAAHDLRSPISNIQMLSSILMEEEEIDSNPKYMKILRMISDSSRFMLNLINDILDYSKIEAGKLTLNLQDLYFYGFIRKVVEYNRLNADQKNINIELQCDENTPEVYFDPGKLEQVINNLISNAIKFSQPETTITVRVYQENNSLITSVADQGPGIPESEMSLLFRPFQKISVRPTEEVKGTGLGLAISRRIIEGHGGKIWVESAVNLGSTFYISLPLHRNMAEYHHCNDKNYPTALSLSGSQGK